MPPRPKRPRIGLPSSPVQPLRKVLDQGHKSIQKARTDIHSIAEDLHNFSILERKTPTATTESPEESFSPAEAVATGTACLPCCRDHLSTSSSALSEAMRFARDNGIKDPEAVRRIRIALEELNIMERIDLAPDQTAKLKGAEKELANWTLTSSRDVRHAITAIKDVDTMELAAAKVSTVTEEFMTRLWSIPEDECETCTEVRESIRDFIEKRKRERGEVW